MLRFVIVSAVTVASLAAPAKAQTPEAAGATVVSTVPGKGKVTNVVRATATVEAIDAAGRTVTLKRPRGDLLTLAVGPEVKNFDQIKVGDQVVARYLESLTLELKKDGKALRSRTERETGATAQPGARPAATGARQVTVVADVTAVDRKNQVVTLRGPQQTVDLKVRDPEQIKLVKVGDQVEATFTEAVALSVDPAPKPAARK